MASFARSDWIVIVNSSIEGLLPLECTPANAVSAATAKIVGNLAPPSCTSPNVCPDPAGHAPSSCISFQRLRLNPEPVSIQGILYPLARLYRVIRPVVICKFLVLVVDSSCLKDQSSRVPVYEKYGYTLPHITTHYFLYLE